MHCSDLERYLEACLDGQLGDSRRRALHDHLRLCRGCAERVDGLRRFEADLQRRLRAMRHEASLWQPLGLEMVNGGPAPTAAPAGFAPAPETAAPARVERGPRHRLRLQLPTAAAEPKPKRRLQNLAGVALLAAAVGALADLTLNGLGMLGGDKRVAFYRAYLDGSANLDVHTKEPGQLSAWFADQLGGKVELPVPPEGFALVGGKAGKPELGEQAALAVYATAEGPALLVIESSMEQLPAATEPTLALDNGLTRLDWQSGAHAYSLISALPPDKLAAFTAD
jgi:anti-sigma factor RsiW